MKKQFNKKRQNLQELKEVDNVQLEAKNIYSKLLSKKLDQKRYRSFKIIKDIGQKVFQLELLEEWVIYNMFSKDLLYYELKPLELGKRTTFVLEKHKRT